MGGTPPRTGALRVDPTLRGWLFVALGGHDALLGRIVLAEDGHADALAAESMIREEMNAGHLPRAGLRPCYALGSVAINTGAPQHVAVIEHAASTLVPFGATLGVGEGGAVTYVALTAFQFCADWKEATRVRVARRLEEHARYAEDAVRGLV